MNSNIAERRGDVYEAKEDSLAPKSSFTGTSRDAMCVQEVFRGGG